MSSRKGSQGVRLSNGKSFCKLVLHSAGSFVWLVWIPIVLALDPQEITGRSDAEVVGYVYEMTGDWLQNGSPLKQGEGVFAGAKIAISPDSLAQHPNDAEIIIHLANGRHEERSAKNPGSLSVPIQLEPLGTREPPFDRVIKAVQSLFVKQPERYIPTMTRGQRSQPLQETVVALQNGAVELTPLFESIPGARYVVRLRPLSASATSPSPSASKTTIDWNPGARSAALVPVAGPGLYRVSIIHPDEGPVGETWLLVCKPESFQAADNAFKSALELTRQWGPSASAEEKHAVLRAYLEHLANEPRRD